MIINRPTYLQKLISSRHNGMIKIVTGVRRCGKSFLLSDLYAEWLKSQGVEDDHIININLEDSRNKYLRDPDVLLGHIDSKNHKEYQVFELDSYNHIIAKYDLMKSKGYPNLKPDREYLLYVITEKQG